MTDEDAFLRKLLENPADDVARLVYADWLDERNEPAKAEFLRLEAETPPTKKRRKQIETRLQELAADLETDWLAVVSKLVIERCGGERQADVNRFQHMHLMGRTAHPTPNFEFECPKQWENLDATDDAAVRFCQGCRENVYYCDTIVTARDHADRGHCVAVDLGLVRKKNDLAPAFPPVGMKMGKMLPGQFNREFARRTAIRKLDPVSEKREQAKRERDDAV